MDPSIEVVFPDFQQQILQERYEIPLFFIVGGIDDVYLSTLMGQDIFSLVQEKSVDEIPKSLPFGVYASRSLLPTIGFARVFPLNTFLNKEWPILLDITGNSGEENNKSNRSPDSIETVWIIRALRRMGHTEMANSLRTRLLDGIYPEKIASCKIPQQLNVNTLSKFYLELSEGQKNYPLIVIVDDLPIPLDKTLGGTLKEISLIQCTTSNLTALKTSLDLISKI